MTTRNLIALCRQKNPSKGYEGLYDRFQAKMNAVCLRYIKDPYVAESVMVNAFYKALTKLDQLKDADRFEPWLRSIVIHEALGYLRTHKKEQFHIDIEEYPAGQSNTSSDQGLYVDDLLNIIRELPTGYRTVFNLFAIEGYSHQEIAAKLGIPVNTSKSNLRRARSMLKNKLARLDTQVNDIINI